MEKPWLQRLIEFTEMHPIVILQFADDDWNQLRETRRGAREFSIARSHSLLKGLRVPSVCLIEGKSDGDSDLYFGLINSRHPVTTLESRITVKYATRIQPSSTVELVKLLSDVRHERRLKEKLDANTQLVHLSPKLSRHLIERLATFEENLGAMWEVFRSVPPSTYSAGNASLQEDAVRTALKAFGIDSSHQALLVEVIDNGDETALSRINISEESVIEHDARFISGYKLVQSDVTGRAVFRQGDEWLEVFTANRRPLERVFGVDLIYLNAIHQSIVMLQYKMLEPIKRMGNTDWVYRPDPQLADELLRMKRFFATQGHGQYEYRLNPAVFYLKFVKRDASIGRGAIIIPVEHYEKLSSNPFFKGPRNGMLVSYQKLRGQYFREDPFLDLIRAGYIGSYFATTANLKVLIEEVLKNGKAVVAAIQSQDSHQTMG